MSRTGRGTGNRAANKRRSVHYGLQRASGKRPPMAGIPTGSRNVSLDDAERLLKAEAKRKRKEAKRKRDV